MSDTLVKRICLYPIKSIDPVAVEAARVLAGGGLEHDREFALFDEQGNVINGKREPGIHRVRARYDLEKFLVTLSESNTFHLIHDRVGIEEWFSKFLERRVSLQRNTLTGFPDDLESPGPTIVGSSTLREVALWFGITDREEAGRRFRANIELDADTPFWEDCLFGEAGSRVEFRLGDVMVHGMNPCQRCAVPSRDPSTGGVIPDFQRVFAERRAATLPAWAAKSRFNHYYRLAVNTRIPASEAGKVIRTGDRVSGGLPI